MECQFVTDGQSMSVFLLLSFGHQWYLTIISFFPSRPATDTKNSINILGWR